MSWIDDAFAPVELVNKAIVLNDTWGHLRPQQKVKHEISIVFCWAESGEIVAIRWESESLDGSPWLQSDMNDFISEAVEEEGKVYRFDGTYQKFKNGNYRFAGKTQVVL